jgi:hypothetical protein
MLLQQQLIGSVEKNGETHRILDLHVDRKISLEGGRGGGGGVSEEEEEEEAHNQITCMPERKAENAHGYMSLQIDNLPRTV